MGINVSARLLSVAGACLILAACGGDDGSTASTDLSTDPSGVNEPTPAPNTETPSGDGGSADKTPSVKNSAPQIFGTPAPAVVQETNYVFQPEAEDADGDILHFSVANPPPWADFDPTTGRLHGMPGAGDLGTYEGIVINVTDGADDDALEPFTITVGATAAGAVELSWQPPTQNTDGTPLTDLAGFKIYWGTESGEYPNSVTLENPGIVTYVLENLPPDTYYFVATAFNTEGTESEPSEEASGEVS